MTALMFVIMLFAEPDVVGHKKAIAQYVLVSDDPHGAYKLCAKHALWMNKQDSDRAYFCKEVRTTVQREIQ